MNYFFLSMKAELISEVWKPIPGYLDLYEVSSFGRVKSLKYGRVKILKPHRGKRRYYYVVLVKDNLRKTFKIHRLVAEVFIPNPNCLPCINHRNEITTDNSVWNLEWCDWRYNRNYGTAPKLLTSKLTNGKKSKLVYQYTIDYQLVRVWPSTAECGRNGFNQAAVSDCCLGKRRRKTYKGFLWSYVPLNNLVQN